MVKRVGFMVLDVVVATCMAIGGARAWMFDAAWYHDQQRYAFTAAFFMLFLLSAACFVSRMVRYVFERRVVARLVESEKAFIAYLEEVDCELQLAGAESSTQDEFAEIIEAHGAGDRPRDTATSLILMRD